MKSFIKLKKLILPEFADTSLLSQNEVGGQNDYSPPPFSLQFSFSWFGPSISLLLSRHTVQTLMEVMCNLY